MITCVYHIQHVTTMQSDDSGEPILCLIENVKTKKYSTLLIQETRHSYEETAIYGGTENGRKAMEDDRKL